MESGHLKVPPHNARDTRAWSRRDEAADIISDCFEARGPPNKQPKKKTNSIYLMGLQIDTYVRSLCGSSQERMNKKLTELHGDKLNVIDHIISQLISNKININFVLFVVLCGNSISIHFDWIIHSINLQQIHTQTFNTAPSPYLQPAAPLCLHYDWGSFFFALLLLNAAEGIHRDAIRGMCISCVCGARSIIEIGVVINQLSLWLLPNEETKQKNAATLESSECVSLLIKCHTPER